MYHILEADKVYEVNDEDPDAIPTVSMDDNDDVKDDGRRKGKGAKGKVSDEDYDPNKDGDDDRADGLNKVVEVVVVAEENGNDVPYEWMFKGYIAFALWGYIPIPGGDKYKSLVMCSVDGDESNIEGGTRKALRKKSIERASIDRALDKRGEKKSEHNAVDKQLADLLTKGRFETQRQKLYQTKVDQLQYQIDFQDRKMDDIKDEMAMLDADDVDDKKELKKQWKACMNMKKKYSIGGKN